MRLVLAVLFAAVAAQAQVPRVIAHEGRLLRADGSPEGGVVVLELNLYPQQIGGSSVWTESQALTLGGDGYYATLLGRTTPLPLFNVPYWLGVTVQGEAEMAPRAQLGAVPYALRAVSAESVAPLLGDGSTNPATSCAALRTARPVAPSGIYWLKPTSAPAAFQAYCDMQNEGGGWTLVWSNLRAGRGKPPTELSWMAAITTAPRIRGTMSEDLESWMVYTGLAHWHPLAPSSRVRYDWKPDYRANMDQRWMATFALNPANDYAITLTSPSQPIGNATPGWLGHSGNRFSAFDADHDTGPSNCAATYSGSPWWYTNCYSGSFWGGGEFTAGGEQNGTFWNGSGGAWGSAGGNGAGLGWIYVK